MFKSTRFVAIAGAALFAATGAAGCGDSSSGSAAAHVAGAAISSSTLDHWVAVMETEHTVPPNETPRRHALSFLISSQWLIDEAASKGVGVSEREVQRRFEEKVNAFSRGATEFDEFLKLTGKTAADVKLEAKAQLAAAKLLALLASREGEVTEAQVAEYYTQNKQEFTTDEQRAIKVTHTRSKAATTKITNELKTHKLTPKRARMESLEYGRRTGPTSNEPLYHAIYTTKPNTFTGPIYTGYGYYFVFEITAIRRPTLDPYAQVRNEIKTHLTSRQRQHTITKFINEWREKWIPQTSCDAGVIVQQCRQYKGPIAAEEPFPAS